jgi:hypothetical protein
VSFSPSLHVISWLTSLVATKGVFPRGAGAGGNGCGMREVIEVGGWWWLYGHFWLGPRLGRRSLKILGLWLGIGAPSSPCGKHAFLHGVVGIRCFPHTFSFFSPKQ